LPQLYTGGGFLAIADFTGDQRKDLAVVLPNGEIGVMPGNGAGGFGTMLDFGPALFEQASPPRPPVQAVDLDGDGRADLATVLGGIWPDSDDSLVVNWNLGGAFSPPVLFDFGPDRLNAMGESPTWPMDLKSGDFNGDGIPDLAVIKGNGQAGTEGYLTMIPNLAHRSFGPPAPLVGAGEDPLSAAVADFDGDGRDDVAEAAAFTDFTGHFLAFRGLANGTLAEAPGPSALGGYALRHWALSVATADFNGDGRPDVAVGCGNPDFGGAAILVVPNITEGFGATLAVASLVSAIAQPDRVSLVWDIGASSGANAVVERRSPSSDWISLASTTADGTGHIRYDDRAVEPGARYAYRLELMSAGHVTTTAETWIDVPATLAFALEGAQPNPTRGPLSVAFTLASTARATVDLLDVTGRRVRSQTIESPLPGSQRLSLAGDGPLAPGLYFLRLTQERRTAQTRVAVVH
jgi:hypothetical protein